MYLVKLVNTKDKKVSSYFYLQKRNHKAAVNGPWDVEPIFLAASEVLNKVVLEL